MSLIDLNPPASIVKPARRAVQQADATRPLTPVPNGYRKIVALGNRGEQLVSRASDQGRAILRTLPGHGVVYACRAGDGGELPPAGGQPQYRGRKSSCDNDIRHNLAAGLTWQLPGSQPLWRAWTISGLGLFRSSRPYTISWGDDRNGTTQNDARPDDRNTSRRRNFPAAWIFRRRRNSSGRQQLAVLTHGLEVFNVFSATNFDQCTSVSCRRPRTGMPASAFPRRRFQLAVITRF